jgi:hypothetical protein
VSPRCQVVPAGDILRPLCSYFVSDPTDGRIDARRHGRQTEQAERQLVGDRPPRPASPDPATYSGLASNGKNGRRWSYITESSRT